MNYWLNRFRNYLDDDLLYQFILMIAIILLSLIIAKIISILIKKIFKPLASKTKTKFDDLIFNLIGESVYKVLIVAGLYYSLFIFKGGFDLINLKTNKTLINQYPFLKNVVTYSDQILFIVLIFILLLISFKVISIAFDWYAEKIHAQQNKDLSGSLFPLLKKISKILLSGLSLAIILAKFKIDISGFVVSLGVGSLAIALAAQDTISNMISGFIIMIDRPFRIGDRIKIGADISGDITEIGIRSTKILDYDNNILIIPNNEIVKSKIVNLTYPTPAVRVLIEVDVGYGDNLEKIKNILMQCAEANTLVSKEFPIEINLLKFQESSVLIRLEVFSNDYKNAFNLNVKLKEQIYNSFKEEGIEIPYPHRVVTIKSDNADIMKNKIN